MASNGLADRAYRERRARKLAAATVCSICQRERCPHCNGEAAHCGSRLGHIDHDVARSKGGAMSWENEGAAHPCCNLKKGDRPHGVQVNETSKVW